MIGRLVVLLLAANLGWLAWSQGWLRAVGLAPQTQTEPERLQRQVRPEAVTLSPAATTAAPARTSSAPEAPQAAASAAVAPDNAPAPTAVAGRCLQAGTVDDKQIEPVRRAAAALPPGSWRIDPVQLPGRWMVYIGKLADAGAVATKRAELRALGVDSDRPGPGMEPGLSLGRFSTEEAADRGLDNLARKGVRTARVVQERRDTPGYVLRLPNADVELRRRAGALRGVLGGRELRDCD